MLLSRSVMSSSLQSHDLQHTRLHCPSLSPWVCSNSCPLSQWCHPTISSSVVHFFSCPQSFPASRSFPMSWVFALGSQSVRASAPRIAWFDLLAVQRTLRSLLQHHSLKASILWPSTFFKQKVNIPVKKVTDGIMLSFRSKCKLFLVILLIAEKRCQVSIYIAVCKVCPDKETTVGTINAYGITSWLSLWKYTFILQEQSISCTSSIRR